MINQGIGAEAAEAGAGADILPSATSPADLSNCCHNVANTIILSWLRFLDKQTPCLNLCY